MTRDEIIRLAREAGLERILAVHEDGTRTVETMRPDLLERFAELIVRECLHKSLAFGGYTEQKLSWYHPSELRVIGNVKDWAKHMESKNEF